MKKQQTKTAKKEELTKKELSQICYKAQKYLVKNFKDFEPHDIVFFFDLMKDKLYQEQFEVINEEIKELKKDIAETNRDTLKSLKILNEEIKELKKK